MMQKELKILLLSSVFVNLAAGLFGPLYAVFVEEIGGSLSTAGFAYSIFAVITGVLIFFISKWEDHVEHVEKLIVVGRILGFVGYFAYIFVDNPVKLYLVQLIFGISAAVDYPAITSFYSKHLDKGKYASEWGAWGSAVWIVSGLSALVGGFMAEIYGFKLLFILMSVFSFLSFVASLFLLKTCNDLQKEKIVIKKPVRHLLHSKPHER
jgi:MFS family permease